MSQLAYCGLPALKSDSPLLWTWVIDGPSGVTRLRMRNGSVGFNLAHLALGFDRRVEGLVEPVYDDWSYAYRPIRGYEGDPNAILSNHCGYACDLNATDHPLGVPAPATFSAEDIRTIHRILDLYDGVIEWGGDYKGRPDGMHFEAAKGATIGDHEKVARRLLDSPRGKVILLHNRGQRRVILS